MSEFILPDAKSLLPLGRPIGMQRAEEHEQHDNLPVEVPGCSDAMVPTITIVLVPPSLGWTGARKPGTSDLIT